MELIYLKILCRFILVIKPFEESGILRRPRHWDRVSVEITGIGRVAIERRREGQVHLRSLNGMERGLKLSGEQRQVMLYVISILFEFVTMSLDILY